MLKDTNLIKQFFLKEISPDEINQLANIFEVLIKIDQRLKRKEVVKHEN